MIVRYFKVFFIFVDKYFINKLVKFKEEYYMPIGFNNFGGGFKTGGIDSAKGKKNDGGSSGGTGYMRQHKKQQDDVKEEFDINGSVFGGEGGIGFHMPSDEELEKMMNEQNQENQNSSSQNSYVDNNRMQNIENNKPQTNFFNQNFNKEDDNFFK